MSQIEGGSLKLLQRLFNICSHHLLLLPRATTARKEGATVQLQQPETINVQAGAGSMRAGHQLVGGWQQSLARWWRVQGICRLH